MSRLVPEPPIGSSPKATRGHFEDAFGPALQRAILGAEGASICDVAKLLGVKRDRLYEVFHGDRAFPAAWLFLLPDSIRVVLCREVLGARHVVADALVGDGVEDHLGHLHKMLRANPAVTYCEALADGVITPAERSKIVSELRESIAVQTALLSELQNQGRSSFTRVRSVGGAA